jgi:hypothetical protein
MATNKKNKAAKVRDMKPSKDAKGGKTRHDSAQTAGHLAASRNKTDGRIIIQW